MIQPNPVPEFCAIWPVYDGKHPFSSTPENTCLAALQRAASKSCIMQRTLGMLGILFHKQQCSVYETKQQKLCLKEI